jgi:DNA-binding response OmpR family regulator
MRVTRDDAVIDLTPTEFEIVATLAGHAGRVYTREQLLDSVRGSAAEAFDRAIDSHVKNIRRKLHRDPRRYIQTVYGFGYKFVPSTSLRAGS